MIFSPLFKAATAVCLALAMSPDCHAQFSNWYRQYTPSYYYYNGTTYVYPRGYRPQKAAPAKTGSRRSAAKSSAEPAKRREAQVERSSSSGAWMSNWNTAWEKACSQGKPLVTLIVHEGCPECEKMDVTLSDDAAMDTLESAVKVRLEFTDNPELISRFNVKFTPTFLVFSPSSNGEVYREVGALSLDRLQMLKPSIDSLVTEPRKAPAKKSAKAKAKTVETDESTSDSIVAL